MKKYFLVIILLLTIFYSFAQSKKKANSKEKPPTQKEMDAMMKEMQSAMDEMEPEDKKIMDSMGIKMPDTKSIKKSMAGVSDAQLKKAYEDDSRIVPLKDAARIAAIPKTVTDSRMGAYITTVQNKAATLLKPAITNMAEKIYSYIKLNSKNNAEAGNMAAGLWMAGKPQIACYTMGKICTDDPANTDNLSNYAVMLSMLGAPHLAIPILNNLNDKFPKNSTLLNNLGQAWFGLGEVEKAEKYLDSVIRIYASHAQANYTKSFIEESKENTTAAVKSVKRSIKNSYTQEKEDRLKHLDYELNSDDLTWNQPMPQDPLGLEKFKWPTLPKNVDESKILEKEWDDFKEECSIKVEELETKLEKAAEEMVAVQEKVKINNIKVGDIAKIINPFAAKASIKLKYLIDGKDGNLLYNYNKKLEAFSNVPVKVASLEEILAYQLTQNEKQYEDKFGEGKENPFESACSDDKKVKNAFLSSANTHVAQIAKDYLSFVRRKINDEVYYYQYTTSSVQFETLKIQGQINWLSTLVTLAQNVQFKDKNEFWCIRKEAADETQTKFTLQAFDDVACKYKSELNLKYIKFTNNCSRMTSEFDFMFLKYVRKDDFERAEDDTYISSTYTISAEAGEDLKAGPLKVEAKIGGGFELEFGRQGLEDVVLIGEAKVGAGTGIFDEDKTKNNPGIGILGKDAFPTTLEVGVEGRISISGKGSVSGTGVLKDIKVAEW
jgi:tetratricopeptide (TPR) repeat protein